MIIIFFPAQSGNPGLPKRAVQGPPFPGESAARVRTGRPGKGTGGECPAPNPPPRRPGVHGCRRHPAPRILVLAAPRPPPDLPQRGPPPGLGPFPPPGASAPLPLSARRGRRPARHPKRPGRAPSVPVQPIAPERSSSVAGRLLPSSLFTQTPHHQEPSAPSGPAVSWASRWTPNPSSSQDAPSSSPATGILPLL